MSEQEAMGMIAAMTVAGQRSDHIKPMELQPTPVQLRKMRVSRNDRCPCGSGKKFKRCCKK